MQPARTCCLSWKGTSGARGQRWQCQVHLRGVPPLPSGKKEGNMGPCWEEVPPCVTLSLLYKDQVGWDENGLLLAGAICWECYFLKRVKWQRCFLVFLPAYKRCLRAISVSPAEKTYVLLRLAGLSPGPWEGLPHAAFRSSSPRGHITEAVPGEPCPMSASA